MDVQTGSTPNSIRRANRGQVLRRVLTNAEHTRVDIANATHLTRTTLTNIVGELTARGILAEDASPEDSPETRLGRRSIALRLSEEAPLICGILILRTRITALLGSMDGRVLERRVRQLQPGAPSSALSDLLRGLFREIMALAPRQVFALSVVSLGPLDCEHGVILNPTGFYAERENFSILDCLREETDLPIFFAHDASAAAIAEKLYGEAREETTFMFLTLEGGIGAGFFLDGRPYNGPDGMNGEIGHTSIRFDGEQCTCGNRGCLELYTNGSALRSWAERYRVFQPRHPIFRGEPDIFDIICLADSGDVLSGELLREYCRYLSYAISNAVTLLNIDRIYIGLPPRAVNGVMEGTLNGVLSRHMNAFTQSAVEARRSHFGLDAPLVGTIAVIMERVFQGDLFPGDLPGEEN